MSEPNSDRSISSVRLHNVSRSVCPTPQLCDLTPILTAQIKQTITTGKPPLHPVAAARSMAPSRMTSNGRPNIPPNRPNVQPMQFQKDMKNGANVNKLQDTQTAKLIHSNARPRGKFQ